MNEYTPEQLQAMAKVADGAYVKALGDQLRAHAAALETIKTMEPIIDDLRIELARQIDAVGERDAEIARLRTPTRAQAIKVAQHIRAYEPINAENANELIDDCLAGLQDAYRRDEEAKNG